MIGEIFDEHTRQDIVDAQALGLDAFALNISMFHFDLKLYQSCAGRNKPLKSLEVIEWQPKS
jgi:hypothetical protein